MSTSGAAQAPGPSSSLTYEPHYGLAEKPFSLTVNPKFLYKSPTHRVAFERLLAGGRDRLGHGGVGRHAQGVELVTAKAAESAAAWNSVMSRFMLT